MDYLPFVATAVCAYLLGSIPTGYLAGRVKGVDIRKVGSGNIGATNVFRFLGKPMGVAVLLIDALKGYLSCTLLVDVTASLGSTPTQATRGQLIVVAGICAVLGHNYTCWLRFKGGKGIATSAGVLLAWVPAALAIIALTWVVLFATTRYVSIASIGAAAVLPFASWFTGSGPLMTVVTSCLSVMAIYKHRSNIQRLMAGTEHRFSPRRDAPEPPR